VRVFKTKWFTRFARKEGLRDDKLMEAIDEIEQGLIDADLGHHLIKKRVARQGGGKRGGYRTLIVYRKGMRAVFVYGFPKSTTDNISDMELNEYQKLARIYLGFNDKDMTNALDAGELQELDRHGQEISK
jgi:hypothetical protein